MEKINSREEKIENFSSETWFVIVVSTLALVSMLR
jgi:hypothetical protein